MAQDNGAFNRSSDDIHLDFSAKEPVCEVPHEDIKQDILQPHIYDDEE